MDFRKGAIRCGSAAVRKCRIDFSEAEVIVRQALAEDICSGDITTEAIIPSDLTLKGDFIAKQSGILAGLEVARLAFTLLDKRVLLSPALVDGEPITVGQVFASVQGPARALLSGERVALNFLQHLSGIATLTHQFVKAVEGSRAVILDTRKTTPNLRTLEKWAVRLGGGQNHRFGLYDRVLIKDNHISAAGGITEAIRRVRSTFDVRHSTFIVEVEVRNLTELQEVLRLQVDRILLDNMNIDKLREAVQLTKGRIPLEASGNVTLANVGAIAKTGIDFISIGALTHSAPALDMSLKIPPAPLFKSGVGRDFNG